MGRKRAPLICEAAYVDGQMLPTFRERYDLILLDVVTDAGVLSTSTTASD